jgi:hypothetical protein
MQLACNVTEIALSDHLIWRDLTELPLTALAHEFVCSFNHHSITGISLENMSIFAEHA